jgi:tRNA nucleotidyltransferase/poly(A) polymerase
LPPGLNSKSCPKLLSYVAHRLVGPAAGANLGEIEKLLLRARRPSIGLGWLHTLGVLDQMFPEIKALIDVPQDPEWHPEGDVFIHTRLTVDRARELIEDLSYPKQVTVMLAALCHDFRQPATTAFHRRRTRSREHEEAGVPPSESFLDRLNVHTLDGYDVRAQVVALVRDHLKPGEFYKKRDESATGPFGVWRASANSTFCIVSPKLIRSAAMPSGCRARNGMTPQRRTGS